MSSPHIAGLAAFILGENPEWTPMTVKSAMMTTAYDLKEADGSADQNPFNQGAGHVDPTRFFNPGLVVTSGEAEWLSFFEGQGFDLEGVNPMPASDLNIPSIAKGQMVGQTTIARTFTGLQRGTWDIDVDLPGFDVTTDAPGNQVTVAANEEQTVNFGEQTVNFTFTPTTAPLGQFATGFVTLTGPTTVRIPVALRPVSVKAPAEVSGNGSTGFTEVDITAGYTGILDIKPSGLAKSEELTGTLATGASVERSVAIVAETKAARFDLDATNDAADLDLYVYRLNDDGETVALAGQSATGAADESVTLTAPRPANYLVVLDGYAAAPGESGTDYRYDEFLVGATGGVGNLVARPNPLDVVQGGTTSFDAVWTDLADGRYLGLFEYDGALAPTYLSVDVP